MTEGKHEMKLIKKVFDFKLEFSPKEERSEITNGFDN